MIVKRIPRRPPDGRGKTAAVGALCTYILSGRPNDPADKLICGGAVNTISKSESGCIAEMQALAQACARSPNPVVHYVISWRAEERPSKEQVAQAVKMFTDDMGYGNNAVIWGAHGNTDNIHVHVAINRFDDTLGRAVRPYRGLDHHMALRAIARIETEQGWQPERNARYAVEDGRVVRTKRRTETVDDDAPPPISYRARGSEIRSGKKSSQRIAQESGVGQTIARASSWDEVHMMLAYSHDASYEPCGGGAVIRMGGRTVKASSVAREASFHHLEKRLGPFEPAPAPLAPVIEEAARRPRAAAPVDDEAARYIEEREAYNAKKRAARGELDERVAKREAELKLAQDAERAEIAGRSWKGKGSALNALRAVLADAHKRQSAELKAEISTERKTFRSEWPDWPNFDEWNRALASSDSGGAQSRKDEGIAMASGTTPTEKQEQTAPVNTRYLMPIVDLLKLHAKDRLVLIGKIRDAMKKGDENATRDAAAQALDKLQELHGRQIASAGERERAEIELAYKERRERELNGGGWTGRGAERNALAHTIKQEYETARTDSLRRQGASATERGAAFNEIRREFGFPSPFATTPAPSPEPAKPKRPSISSSEFERIKQTSPEHWLQNARGYVITRKQPHKFFAKTGNDEIYRCERKANGDWMTFTKSGECVGNNVTLAKYEAGLHDLLDVAAAFGVYPSGYISPSPGRSPPPASRPAPEPETPAPQPPFVPPVAATPSQREAGRQYLIEKRGIPVEIVEFAEQCGFLSYTTHQVAFCGFDADGNMRSAQLRRFDDSTVLEKGVTRGSDLGFPALFVGEDISRVVIAESGISALSVLAIERENGLRLPTVISTGGVGSRSWTNNAESPARAAILGVQAVFIAGENESSEAKQREKDGARLEMAHRIAAATGRDPLILYPPTFGSDANDLLLDSKIDPIDDWLHESPRWPSSLDKGASPPV